MINKKQTDSVQTGTAGFQKVSPTLIKINPDTPPDTGYVPETLLFQKGWINENNFLIQSLFLSDKSCKNNLFLFLTDLDLITLQSN